MNAEMLKGHLDNVILAVLEAGSLHGYAVIEAIRQRSGGSFDLPEGTIYPALHRLELAGLLSSEWFMPPSGRKRRLYSLTTKGTAALSSRRDNWETFSRAVSQLLEPNTQWPA
jgi:PadR family transcriptional regulator, regulatory protein PadR